MFVKDWQKHHSHWRAVVIALILASCAVAIVKSHNSATQSTAQHTEDEKQIAGLKTSVETAHHDQDENALVFEQVLADMSQKLTDVQVGIQTTPLRQQIDDLATELDGLRKNAVTPKAMVLPTLSEPIDGVKLRTLDVSLQPNNIVKFTVYFVNTSLVQADRGEIWITLCNGCTYAKEPDALSHIDGASGRARTMRFDSIPAKAALAVILEVFPPRASDTITVLATVRCETCAFSDAVRLNVNFPKVPNYY